MTDGMKSGDPHVWRSPFLCLYRPIKMAGPLFLTRRIDI